jgi:hypothetical protein
MPLLNKTVVIAEDLAELLVSLFIIIFSYWVGDSSPVASYEDLLFTYCTGNA